MVALKDAEMSRATQKCTTVGILKARISSMVLAERVQRTGIPHADICKDAVGV
jgi:hypothetical protein